MRTFEEYKAFYEKHAGKLVLNPRFDLYFHPDHGFSEFRLTDKFLFAGAMAGDMDYWLAKAKDMCRKHGLISMTTFTPRNLKAYLRRIGFKIDHSEVVGDITKYHAYNKEGQHLLAEPYNDGYILTWGVK